MDGPSPLDFRQPSARTRFEAQRGRLARVVPDADADGAVESLHALATALDSGVALLKETSFARIDEDLARWIGEQHEAIVEACGDLLEAFRDRPGTAIARLVASSLHHSAQALKWSAGSRRADFDGLHRLFLVARAHGRHRGKFLCQVDGSARRTSIESLYLRVLLLDRWTGGGTLPRVQIEILDAWLWEWSDLLRGQGFRPLSGPCLRVDLDADAGLREGARADEGPVLYLPLARLEEERRHVAQELQHGRLVPSQSLVARLPIEDHVAVVERLGEALRPSRNAGDSRRQPRRSARGTRVEVWLGLEQVLARGMRVGVETGRFPTLCLDEALEAEIQRARVASAARRFLWLCDENMQGFALEGTAEDGADIEVGDLIAWRRAVGAPVVVGRVVRRQRRTPQRLFLGVESLSACAQAVEVRTPLAEHENVATLLYVAGGDRSGSRDGFLMPAEGFDPRLVHWVRVGGRDFALRFNRVRCKGRGWYLAGFEIVPDAARPAREAPLPATEAIDDPWMIEVPARLQG